MYSGPEAANYQINQSIKSNKYVLFIEAFYFLVLLFYYYICVTPTIIITTIITFLT